MMKSPEYGTMSLTAEGVSMLKSGEGELTLAQPQERERTSKRKERKSKAVAGLADGDQELFVALKALRRTLAQERGVPPYIIFGDVTLRELASQNPTTLTACSRIKGIGAQKL